MAAHSPLRRTLDEVAALPVRLHPEGFVEVLLVTSSENARWAIPKGWSAPDLSAPEIAEREAREQAGLIGNAGPNPIGEFAYDKRLSSGLTLPCKVAVHLFRTTGQLERWPDRSRRDCAWLSSREAAKRVCNLSLQRIILRVGRSPELLRPAVRRSVEGRIGGATPKLA